MGTEPELRFATASIKVDYLKPTPINTILHLRGKVKELTNKKVLVRVDFNVPLDDKLEKCHPYSVRKSEQVRNGIKWTMNVWFRERKYE